MMITTEKESIVLLKLAAPMIGGILGMIIFNLMDTWYVGRLGTIELAALSFTFPVVLVISSIAHGLGVGMTAAVSRAVGRKDLQKQKDLITWGLILAFVIVVFFVIIGQLTIEPIFRMLGADGETLPVIKEYMRIWYWGVVFVVIPMVGNSAIRGLGDTKTPSMVMLIAAVINTILDPLLIFGIGPFPELGVKGAAIATVIARATTFSVALYILIHREKIFVLSRRPYPKITAAWKEILHVGIPNSLSKIIIPLGTGFITSMIAVYGRNAVAGFGVASKIEMFALLPVHAIISVIPVFIGQNIGAGRADRVKRGLSLSGFFSLIFGAAIFLLLFFFGRRAGKLFNDNTEVVGIIALYMKIVPSAYLAYALMQLAGTSLSVMKKPIRSALISLIQMFAVYLPLAYLATERFGISGIFASLALSWVIVGLPSFFLTKKSIRI
jgi:putative MATE family efflux protein